ncbi:ferritin-like domain-containing protein [Metaclostridioides mangenotii]|uniref:ferritin-like domain-containing protein n=1 Tax=Metaclostridioides mangenotii TaxID=1540 RepID=UPI000689C0DD|nr:ferritin-like domain-containing protein [Clostridioides mangenotii]
MYEEIYPDPIELQNSINMIGESIISKERHLQFFQWLIDHVRISELSPIPSLSLSQAKQVIILLEYIRDEELKHAILLQNIYYQLTGTYAPLYEGAFYPPKNLIAGLENALRENLESIKKYELITNGLPSSYYRDLISSIISDELNHIELYNSLLTKFSNIEQIIK